MNVSVREIQLADAQATARLLNEVIEEGLFTIMVEPIDDSAQRAWIEQLAKQSACYVAEGEGGSIIGIQSIEPMSTAMALRHVGDISTFVHPSAYRHGIGKRLSDATLQKAKDIGYTKVMAMIRADNPRAQSFYQSIGFHEIGVAKNHAFVRGKYIDEVLMERFL